MGNVPNKILDPRLEKLNRILRFDNGKERCAWFVRMGPVVEVPHPSGGLPHYRLDKMNGLCFWLVGYKWWESDLNRANQYGTQKEAEYVAAEYVLKYPEYIGSVDAILLGIPYNSVGDPADVPSCSP